MERKNSFRNTEKEYIYILLFVLLFYIIFAKLQFYLLSGDFIHTECTVLSNIRVIGLIQN